MAIITENVNNSGPLSPEPNGPQHEHKGALRRFGEIVRKDWWVIPVSAAAAAAAQFLPAVISSVR